MKKIAQGNNPHVVNMLGCVTLQEPLVLITEFVEYGDLHSYLTTCRKQVSKLIDNIIIMVVASIFFQMQMQQKMMENDKGVKKSVSVNAHCGDLYIYVARVQTCTSAFHIFRILWN